MHQDAPIAHLPFVQRPEQHVVVAPASAPHGLPAVAQLVFSGLHVPPVQMPLQHCAAVVHD